MAKFAYNIAKNTSTNHMPFELNCGYYPSMSFKNDVNSQFKPKSANKLLAELRELMIVCWKNLYHAQKL